MSANIVRIFYLELVLLQNSAAPFEGYRIGHAETARNAPCPFDNSPGLEARVPKKFKLRH